MKLKKIISDRKSEQWPSWQIVYEWEDIFSNSLNIPISDPDKAEVFIFKVFRRLRMLKLIQWLDFKRNLPAQSIYFVMYTGKSFIYPQIKSTIPAIIDFYLRREDLEEFYIAYQNCECVLISSKEAFQFLKDNGCPLKIYHFPLSISDKYKLTEQSSFKKTIDVLFAGRRNPVLWDYVKRYALLNPDFEYVYQVNIDGKLTYESNKKGVIGDYQSREEYISLIKSAKISFYATPGMDGNEDKTGGFNQVTPRFLELMSAGCLLIGRYPANPDTDFYELNEYCPFVDSYQEFETLLNQYLVMESYPKEKYIKYLNKHYSSVRANQLAEMFR